MKSKLLHLSIKVLALLLLFCSPSFSQTSTPLAANGSLKVINRQLCNQSGKAIQLRGMSSHGLQWFGQCYNASAIQKLSTDWGIDVFRAAMYVDEGGYLTNKANYRNTVNSIVDWCEQNGVYAIIDWHILNPGDPNLHLADAQEFFHIMAQRNAGKKHVIYEICNEPNGVSWSSVKSYAQQVIPTIRQYDSEAIILVGTPNWSGTPGDVTNDPLTGATAYNVMYTFHFYAGSHYTQNYINTVLQTVPLFVSEWGTSNYSGDGGNDYANAQSWINLLGGNNTSGIKVSWCNWSFCDKNESSAALLSGSCSSASWNNTSTSGTWVKDKILNPADDFGPPTPAISITSPANNSTVIIGNNVTIAASVVNATPTSVQFYRDSTLLGSVATAPYSFTINNIQAGIYNLSAKAILSSSVLSSSVVKVTATTPPNQVPSVSLTSPANNATYAPASNINITANASDTDGSISKVEFYNGNTKLGESTTAPYAFTWANVAAGTYAIAAKATDNQGATSTSTSATIYVGISTANILGPDCASLFDSKTFEVNALNLANATAFSWWCTGSTQSVTPVSGQNYKATINFGGSFTGGQVCVGINYSVSPWYVQYCKNVTVCTGTPSNQAPTVSITSPANNATFTAPASITINANAADSDGTISKVDFYNGTTKIGTSTTPPYSFAWTNVAAGNYAITAQPTDNLGATTTSAATAVSVNNPVVNQAPTVSITSPANNATFTAPASITINANAADSDGTISKVDFYNGATKIGTDTSSPYGFAWTNVAAGNYTITAQATDNLGATTTSAGIAVSVTTSTATEDIIGSLCASINNVKTYTLSSANMTNATTYAWWCTGSTQSITPVSGQPQSVSINFGQWFTGGQVCVGVNYSASPWYKQYCKNVTVCSASGRISINEMFLIKEASTDTEDIVFPNPSNDEFSFTANKNVKKLIVNDFLGREKITMDAVSKNQKVTFGRNLPSGMYLIHLFYEDNSQNTIKVLKEK